MKASQFTDAQKAVEFDSVRGKFKLEHRQPIRSRTASISLWVTCLCSIDDACDMKHRHAALGVQREAIVGNENQGLR